MKIVKANGKEFAVEEYNIPGLMEFSLHHEIKESQALMQWCGPKIPLEEWQRVLSFFKWTYDTTKSESQVRLFVNVEAKTWKAWAFPQEAQSGMAANEIHNAAFQEQRQRFGDEWDLFGTVHHHCSASAFQSSTDENNEKNQGGIHITIGNMDKPKYDLHGRLYRRGRKFEPDMSWFMDVSAEIESIPEAMIPYMPKGLSAVIARDKMCTPSSVEFPEQWKANMIERPKEERNFGHFCGGVTFPSTVFPQPTTNGTPLLWQKARAAWGEVEAKLGIIADIHIMDDQPIDAIYDALEEMDDHTSPHGILAYAMHHHGVDPDDMLRERLWFNSYLLEEERKESAGPEAPKADAPAAPPQIPLGMNEEGGEWLGYLQGKGDL